MRLEAASVAELSAISHQHSAEAARHQRCQQKRRKLTAES
jgi:hypothetical protein